MSAAGEPALPPRGPMAAVAIGASAGAVEALSIILPALPSDSLLPVFIVVHVPRDQPNMLIEIFARKCRVRVKEAEDKEPIVAGTIYFAPADYHVLIEQGPSLALSLDAAVNFSRPSIDVLFESAADVYGPSLIGAVLTGASSDGAAGLSAIARAGGTALCEAPEAARSPTMPRAALLNCPSARALPLSSLAAFLRHAAECAAMPAPHE
jgi:two-component system chemotaxis response regulator CheB